MSFGAEQQKFWWHSLIALGIWDELAGQMAPVILNFKTLLTNSGPYALLTHLPCFCAYPYITQRIP